MAVENLHTAPAEHGIQQRVHAQRDALIALRRHMHAHPELSRHEVETTRTLLERLTPYDVAITTRPDGPGFFIDLTPPHFDPSVHPTVALRTDIDALAIVEQTGLPFASKHPGVMHACGHDMHMACVFGATDALHAVRDQLPGRVRVFYQHAEEVAPGGALDLIALGCMDRVQRVLGLHCDPTIDVGHIGIKTGPFTAASDAFEMTLHGTGGHSARPHEAVDAIFLATRILQDLYTAAGRLFDARKPVVIAVGAIQGGQTHNVLSHQATIKGTVRSIDPDHRAAIPALFERIASSTCQLYGGRFDLHVKPGAPAIHNDPGTVDTLRRIAAELLGPDAIHTIPLPSMGAEDFSEYLQHAPGAMFRLGVKRDDQPEHFLHSPRFDPHEDAIGIGARIMALGALEVLRELRG